MRRMPFLLSFVAILLAIFASPSVFAQQTRITIGEDTTRVTSPLRPDGYVDYIGAINELASEGVTPGNNAAVPLVEIFGPSEIPVSIRARFVKMLGIKSLPEDGNYLVSSGKFAKQLDEEGPGPEARDLFLDTFQEAMERPWTRDEFPLVAEWVEVNESFLPRIIKATHRSKYYTPLLTADKEEATMIAVLLPILQQSRDAARLLKAHAMLCLGEGRVDEAWEDLLACHRFSRLCGKDVTIIGALVAVAIDGIAVSGDAQLIESGQLSAAQYKKMVGQLRDVGPLPSIAEKVDRGERYMFLDVVGALARGHAVDLFGNGGGESGFEKVIKSTALSVVDWDHVLRTANSWYDRIVDGMQRPTHAERQRVSKALEKEVQKIAASTKSPWRVAAALFAPREVASDTMSNVLIALLLPALNAAQVAEGRGNTAHTQTQIGFALAAYRADHEQFPESLRELTPKYISELPEDPFTGGDYVYQRKGTGFLLYSLGPNMEDNQGKVYHLDREHPELGPATRDWDDYRLEIQVQLTD